ncbi:hypothetical protein AB0L00_38065 [Actinoallomurus sp. NPDC052308]|uniref:hypothetical protein n=1 Tax=Actinoallomurus sp. NPDC052308 TaxID=3155530 RepID=UPI00344016F5
MEALSEWVIRHRLIVGLSWLVITMVGVLAAPSVSSRLVGGNHVNGPAFTANTQIARHYGGVTSDPAVVVLDAPAGETVRAPGVRAQLRAVDAAIARSAPTLRVVSYASTGSQTLVGSGGRSAVLLAYPPKDGDDMGPAQIDALTHAVAVTAPGLGVHGTSLRALEAGNTTSQSVLLAVGDPVRGLPDP